MFTKESNGWVSTSYTEKVGGNQKDKILSTLKGEEELKKMRYENKLAKMR
jgi:hypothetical protein